MGNKGKRYPYWMTRPKWHPFWMEIYPFMPFAWSWKRTHFLQNCVHTSRPKWTRVAPPGLFSEVDGEIVGNSTGGEWRQMGTAAGTVCTCVLDCEIVRDTFVRNYWPVEILISKGDDWNSSLTVREVAGDGIMRCEAAQQFVSWVLVGMGLCMPWGWE